MPISRFGKFLACISILQLLFAQHLLAGDLDRLSKEQVSSGYGQLQEAPASPQQNQSSPNNSISAPRRPQLPALPPAPRPAHRQTRPQSRLPVLGLLRLPNLQRHPTTLTIIRPIRPIRPMPNISSINNGRERKGTGFLQKSVGFLAACRTYIGDSPNFSEMPDFSFT